MRVAYKVWLDSDGKAFGEGPYLLLMGIERTGSLHQAAMEMKMSYRKAWAMIQASEKRLGFPLLDRKVGGHAGGGSRITPEGRRLMERYGLFRKDVEAVLERTYAKHFGP